MKKVSITATRGPEKLSDIPATVTVKDSAEIERELARDIKDLVRYEPGVSVQNSAARFGQAGFNIRGIEGNRVAMRIDGARMSDAFAIGSFSDARRNLVDLDMMKQVDILRGPASALYGSDAIAGVVSFITKDPADVLAGERIAARFKAAYHGDSEERTLSSTFAAGDDALNSLLYYRRSEGGETENQGTSTALPFSSPTLLNTRTAPNFQDREADSLLGKVVWNASEAHTLKVSISHDRAEAGTEVLSAQGRGVGAFANFVTVSLDGDDEQRRTRVGLQHAIKSSAALFDELTWDVYFQDTEISQRSLERRYTFAVGPSSTIVRDRLFLFEQNAIGVEAVARKAIAGTAANHLFTYGIDLVRTETEQLRDGVQLTQATGAVTSNIAPDNFPVRDFPNSEADQYALFVQDRIEFVDGKIQLTPGVRVDYYKLTPKVDTVFAADNPGVAVSTLTETSVSPKIGALWRFVEDYSLYASYARGFRAPPYNDVNIGFTNLAFGYTAIANPDLKSESSNGYEIGVRREFDATYFALTGFYNDYRDFIHSLVPIGIQGGLQVFQSQNLSEAHIYGAEFRAGVQPIDSIRIRASAAYARGSGGNVGQPAQALNSVDPLKGVIGVAYEPSKRWNVELIGTAVERHKHVNQATPQFVPAGYLLVDVIFHAEWNDRFDVNVGLFNLTDEKYWDWTDVRGVAPTSTTLDRTTRPGFNASANLAVRF